MVGNVSVPALAGKLRTCGASAVEGEGSRAYAEEVAGLLTGWGIPPDRQDDYLAEVRGMVGLAMDDYFASLREGTLPSVEPAEAKSSGETSG
jgi:hypothetical protein